MAQEGLGALRVRRMLALEREGDEPAARALVNELSIAESREGLFADSPMKTAGLLNLLDDLCAGGTEALVAAGASYLVGSSNRSRVTSAPEAWPPAACGPLATWPAFSAPMRTAARRR